jgi:RNA recognition motif-containing protein
MPHEYDEAMIREYWSYCGEIENMELLYFPDTGNFNGVMFITFTTEDSYQAALACNGEEVEGRFLRVSPRRGRACCKQAGRGMEERVYGWLGVESGAGCSADCRRRIGP